MSTTFILSYTIYKRGPKTVAVAVACISRVVIMSHERVRGGGREATCNVLVRRVRAAGGGLPRGGVPRRRRRRVPPRRLPLLPHPRAAAARAAPPLTPSPAAPRTPPRPQRSRL